MSDFLPPVVVKLLADVAEFNAAMGEAGAKLEGFQAAQAKLAGAGKVAMAGLALAAAGVAVESVNLAQKFDQAMELIHTQAGASQAEVEALKGKVLDLAPAVGIGPEKLAEGLYHIESTGFRGKEALDILTAAAKDASMGLADLDKVTYALSGVMSVGMHDVRDAADATAYLNTIVGMGDMTMDKLASAIGTGILPSMKSAGLGMKDFGAALATISDNSVGADEAATRLRMTISLMAAPTKKAQDALASIGIGQHQLADDMRKPDGLLVAVMDLKDHLEQSGKTASEQNAIISQAFGGGRSSSAILTLIEESDRLKGKYGQIGTAATRAATQQEAWAQQQKQFSQQMHELGAEVQVIGVKIGEFLIPYIQKSAEWLTKHIAVVKIAAVVIGSLLVAAMMAFTYAVIENTVAMLANPVTWIVLGIVAAIALLAVGIYELVKHWSTVWGWIKRIALDVWNWLVLQWTAIWNDIKSVVNWIWNNIIQPIVSFFWNGLIKPLIDYFTAWWHIVEFVFDVVAIIAKDFLHAWSVVFEGIGTAVSWWWNNIVVPVYTALWNWAIKPTMDLLQRLYGVWLEVFHAAEHVLSEWWDGVKWSFDQLMHYAVNPTMDILHKLEDVWKAVFGAVSSFLSHVWNAEMKPIFDLIMKGLHEIQNAWNSVMSSPGSAAKSVTKFLGFADGGWVPGSPGQPRLAIVHGGEYVLSRDMISSGTTGAGGPSAPLSGGSGGAGGGGTVHIHNHLYVDGQELHGVLIGPAQRYKARTGSTGLT